MLTLFLEHNTIRTARRALFITGFLTLLLAGVSITSNELDVFGLTIHVEQQQLLNTMRIVSFYFSWIFVWLLAINISNGAKETVTSYISTLIEKQRQAANNVDVDPDELQDGYFPEMEPWWEHFYDYETKAEKRKKRFEVFFRFTSLSAMSAIEYLPPLAVGISAVFFPTAVHDWAFSFFDVAVEWAVSADHPP